jgi:nucleoside-diphosphate-sugar epimerase
MADKTILITGANGFLGRALVSSLGGSSDCRVRAAVRRPAAFSNAETAIIGDLSDITDWTAALKGAHAIVHAAARVHMMKGSVEAADMYRQVNVAGTLGLARQAVRAGVARFVFVSSIKVNGESTPPGQPFAASDTARPRGPYAESKYEAEEGLRQLALATGLEVVIVRPVLVYGPGVAANFRSMMRWIRRGIPLPFGGVQNSRSYIAISNLVDVLAKCVHEKSAANETFLVSDGEDLSTPELLRRTASAMGRQVRLIPVPQRTLEAAARLLGKRNVGERLYGSLTVDIAKTRQLLDWTPRVSVDAALKETVNHFVNCESR